MKLLYKREDNQKLVVVGHLNAHEIKELRREGYKFPRRQYNKHGIRVVNYATN